MSQAQIARDLTIKIGDDVNRAIGRVLSIAPSDLRYILTVGACTSALGFLTGHVSRVFGYRTDLSFAPDPGAIMLAALIAARAGMPESIDKATGEVVELAKGDLAALKRVGRI